ncbi:three component ABC system middle component [Corallococcus sp. 4LFB]|uniref:three component ABC system middle component n=1 Tax=Corallococcus sp. 4LFB TaxID=3383249 RepID=UPI003976E250
MIPWRARSIEERNLLNPGFCSVLLWHSALGYTSERKVALPIELSFLVLPFVLHRETRESLPRNIKSSLPTWLAEQPIVRTRISERASALRPFTREALVFGGSHGLLSLSAEGVHANAEMKKRVTAGLKPTSDEVRACAKHAEFLGRWLEKAGDSETVMALLGVRP